MLVAFFFFNDTATTEIYTLSLHDALPILSSRTPTRPPGFGSRGEHPFLHSRPDDLQEHILEARAFRVDFRHRRVDRREFLEHASHVARDWHPHPDVGAVQLRIDPSLAHGLQAGVPSPGEDDDGSGTELRDEVRGGSARDDF